MENDIDEMRKIYERNVDSVYRLCFSYVKNKSDAEDMVQETFIKLFEKEMNFKNEEHERGWLIITASNLCRNFLKHWWRSTSEIKECDSVIDSELQLDDTLAEIMKLPEKYRKTLFLFYYEGYSTMEISKLLNKNKSTIRSLLKRGREKLRITLGGQINE